MDLTPAQGKIALDYVSVERCGATVPARTVLLADDFDDGLNALDIPSGSSWSPGTVAAVGGRARAHGSSKMTAGSIGSLPPYHQIRFVSRFRGESAYANLTIGQYGYYWSAIPGQEYLLGSVLGTSGTAPNLPDQDHFVTISRGPNGLSLVVELGGFGGSRPFLKDLPPGAGNNPNTEWSAASDRAPGDYIELDDLEVSTYSF